MNTPLSFEGLLHFVKLFLFPLSCVLLAQGYPVSVQAHFQAAAFFSQELLLLLLPRKKGKLEIMKTGGCHKHC